MFLGSALQSQRSHLSVFPPYMRLFSRYPGDSTVSWDWGRKRACWENLLRDSGQLGSRAKQLNLLNYVKINSTVKLPVDVKKTGMDCIYGQKRRFSKVVSFMLVIQLFKCSLLWRIARTLYFNWPYSFYIINIIIAGIITDLFQIEYWMLPENRHQIFSWNLI